MQKLENEVSNTPKTKNEFTNTDFKRANVIINSFINRIEETAMVRFASSRDEKNSAIKIRELYHKTLGLSSRMEPFTVSPLAGRFGIPILGAIYLVALFLYVLGVSIPYSGRIAFLFFSMLTVAFVGVLAVVQVYLNKNTFNVIFPKKTSYNVFSNIEPQKEVDFTFILGSHYDSDMDKADTFGFFKDKNLNPTLLKVIRSVVIGSVPLLFVFTIMSMFIKPTAVSITLLLIFPLIICGFSIFYLATYFSYNRKHSKKGRSGIVASGMALAVTDYFRQHPGKIPDNCRFIIASFGSKECGAKGSEQFLEEHWGRDDALINPYFVNISEVETNGYKVILGENQIKQAFDRNLSNAIYNSLKSDGLNPVYENNKVMFTDSYPFAVRKVPTTTMQLNGEYLGESLSFDEPFKGAVNAVTSALDYILEQRNALKSKDDADIFQELAEENDQ